MVNALKFYLLHPKNRKLIDGWIPTIPPIESEGMRECVHSEYRMAKPLITQEKFPHF